MADVTIAAPGKVVGNNDRLALFLKVFAGEVLAAFNGKSVTLGRHIERNISSGKSAQFPVFGRAAAAYLKAGGNLDDLRVNIEHAEKIIQIDGLLTSDCLIFDLDEAMAHFDLRGEYSRQLGEALARANDGAVLAELAKMVVADTENIPTNQTTGVKGTGKGSIETKTVTSLGENEETGVALFEELLAIKTKMSNNYVPEDERYCYIKPVALNALIAAKDVMNKLYGATMTIADNQPPKLIGFELIETPDLTVGGATVNDGVVQGSGHVFPATYVDSCQMIVAHRTAVGTLTLKGLAVEHARRANLQADQIIAKYAKGYSGLRPEAAFMGVITES
jgi:hypothetical protein